MGPVLLGERRRGRRRRQASVSAGLLDSTTRGRGSSSRGQGCVSLSVIVLVLEDRAEDRGLELGVPLADGLEADVKPMNGFNLGWRRLDRDTPCCSPRCLIPKVEVREPEYDKSDDVRPDGLGPEEHEPLKDRPVEEEVKECRPVFWGYGEGLPVLKDE